MKPTLYLWRSFFYLSHKVYREIGLLTSAPKFGKLKMKMQILFNCPIMQYFVQ